MPKSLGISVFRDGNVIQLAGTSLGVAEACSGLNSLSALIVGSLLLGYLLCSRATSRVLLCLAAIPLAIGVNIVRVAGTALLADYNQEFALGFYHSFSGWLVFVAGFGLLYLCARALARAAGPEADRMNNPISLSFTATAVLLLGTIFLGEVTARRIPEPLAVPLDKIPAQMAGWTASSDKELPARTLQVLDATSYLSRPYQKDSQDLDLFIAFYAQQRAGESMHSPKHCLPGSGWEIWKHDSAWIPFDRRTGRSQQILDPECRHQNADVLLVSIQEPHHCQRIPR